MYKYCFFGVASIGLLCSFLVYAGDTSSEQFDREFYRFSLTSETYHSPWVFEHDEVFVICRRHEQPLLLENGKYFALSIGTSSAPASTFPKPNYLPSYQLKDAEIFLKRAELKCQSIAELEGFNRSLRRNRLIEFKALAVEGSDWQMQVSQLKSTYGDHLAVFSDRELKHLFVPEDPMDRYERSSWLDYPEFKTPMLLSVWRRGAHGEQLRIHSLARDKTVYTVISAWPLSYIASADGIHIEITGYSDTSDEPFEEEIHLKVIDLIQMAQGN